MNIIQKRWVSGILLAGWMILIFCFSAQPAPESSELSGTIAYQIVDVTDHAFKMELSGQERLSYAAKIEYPVRKIAHMTEYAIMGLLSFAFLKSFSLRGKKCYLAALMMAVAYAATDEFHQLFVSGRSGAFRDVCIDTTGAVIGLFILYLVRKLRRKHCEKKQLPLQ